MSLGLIKVLFKKVSEAAGKPALEDSDLDGWIRMAMSVLADPNSTAQEQESAEKLVRVISPIMVSSQNQREEY